jgi:multidrug resistance efflux pump
MDIKKEKTAAPWKKPALVLTTLSALVLMGTLFASPSYQYKVEQSALLLGAVKRGDLLVTVDGYGVLRSDKQKLISALAPATVEEVVLKAGAVVQADSVILRLSDPELMQQIETASMATAQEQANFRRQHLNNQRDMLTEEGRFAELDARYQMLVLRHSAEADMAAKGIVSQLNYQTTVLEKSQLAQQVKLQQKRLEQLKLVNQEALTISQEQLNQAIAREQRLKQRLDQLTVRSGIEGVLQRVPVELGQSVTAGQELALVGSDKDLLALVRVSQSKAEQIRPGQKARINTRREQADAVVSRVTPQVVEGTIEVELTFVDAVPVSARPELNIDAQIFTAELTNTLYLDRPVNSQSHSQTRLFKLDPHTHTLTATAVQFGDEAGRFLQLHQGATEGEQFVLSDMAKFQDADTVSVVR